MHNPGTTDLKDLASQAVEFIKSSVQDPIEALELVKIIEHNIRQEINDEINRLHQEKEKALAAADQAQNKINYLQKTINTQSHGMEE
jgi:hypothetical protein